MISDELREEIKRDVATWPPLTAEQRAILSAIFSRSRPAREVER